MAGAAESGGCVHLVMPAFGKPATGRDPCRVPQRSPTRAAAFEGRGFGFAERAPETDAAAFDSIEETKREERCRTH